MKSTNTELIIPLITDQMKYILELIKIKKFVKLYYISNNLKIGVDNSCERIKQDKKTGFYIYDESVAAEYLIANKYKDVISYLLARDYATVNQ